MTDQRIELLRKAADFARDKAGILIKCNADIMAMHWKAEAGLLSAIADGMSGVEVPLLDRAADLARAMLGENE